MPLKGVLLGSTSWELLYHSLRANFDGEVEQGFIAGVERKDGDGKAKYLYGKQVISLRDVGSDSVEVEYVDEKGKKANITSNLVIGADGPSSTIRSLFLPEVTREHVGYVVWRGTVAQSQLSPATRETLRTSCGVLLSRQQCNQVSSPTPYPTAHEPQERP